MCSSTKDVLSTMEAFAQMPDRLKELRRAKGITQKELSRHLRVDYRTVSLYETGLSTPPVEVLLSYSQFFKVSIEYLFFGEEAPNSEIYDRIIHLSDKRRNALLEFIESFS